MGRRIRRRWVVNPPSNDYFLNEQPLSDRIVILTLSEFEAMRLKHYVNLTQKEAAEKMGVSQPTFSRILESAHQKTTKAIFEGKEIRVFGGHFNYRRGFVGYGCLDCNHEWEDETASKDKKVNCVKCDSVNVYYLVREII